MPVLPTQAGKLKTVAGGGDTVAALAHAAVLEQFSYVSTAGGAFREWIEGKALPGAWRRSPIAERGARQSAPTSSVPNQSEVVR